MEEEIKKSQCLRCGKEYLPHPHKYRFCKNCRIDYGNEMYLDNGAKAKINEYKDRKHLPSTKLWYEREKDHPSDITETE